MKTKSTLLLACAALAAATAMVPAAASAQSYRGYDQRGGYAYDACARDTSNRSATGGLLGLAVGAAAGSNLAGRNNRHEGTALGGVVGALVGSQIGKNSAACRPEARTYAYAEPAYNGPAYAYDEPAYAPPPPPPPPARSYYDDRGRRDQCEMVESRIRMPDGRSQTRMVRTCPDSSGRYQIVD